LEGQPLTLSEEQHHALLTDLPPTIFSDPSANEGISLFFAL
jgi:hypothetical protein